MVIDTSMYPVVKQNLFPALQNAAAVLRPVVRDVLHEYAELAALCRYLLRVIPLLLGGGLVPEASQ
jgi:hypothetical protein